jgi:hypothetical protein
VPLALRGRSTLELVETRDGIRDFLTSRRAKLKPEQVGPPDCGHRAADDVVGVLRAAAGRDPGSRHEDALRLLSSWTADTTIER